MIRIPLTARGPELAWVLDCTVHDLQGHWLLISCENYPCRKFAIWSFAMLENHYSPATPLSAMLLRLRCSECSAKAGRAILRQTIARQGDRRTPSGWGLQVWPELKVLEEFRSPSLILEGGRI